MKSFIGLLLVASVALTGVLSLPAGNPSDDAEVIGYPRRVTTRTENAGNDDDVFNDFKGVIDTGSGYPFLQPNPSVLNFGFFDSFDDLFRRFRARLWPVSVLGRGGEESDEDSGSGGFGIGPNFDTSKGNTTSTVKIVDGHKVEVNETVYGDERSVFKVRVVNVRPLEDGENVEETVRTSSGSNDDNSKPSTSAPETKPRASVEDDDDGEEGRREPLSKKPNENEIEGNIDEPEHLSVTESNIEVATIIPETKNSGETEEEEEEEDKDEYKMLPTTTEDLMAFVTDNADFVASGEGEELSVNGNGNNEFETNMSSLSMVNSGEKSAVIADADVDDVGAIENNENTVEVNDNLNESSSTSDVEKNYNDDDDDDGDAQEYETNNKKAQTEFEDDDDDDDDVQQSEFADADPTGEVVNANIRHSNYAVIRNKQREDVTSSDDDEDEHDGVAVMHPTFNDEWGTLNDNNNNNNNNDGEENNDLSNDIDVYDVEPIDLSNDIAVNDDANLPLNPDAEFIDVFGSKQTLRNMPKFEKLSLSKTPASAEDLSSFSVGNMK